MKYSPGILINKAYKLCSHTSFPSDLSDGSGLEELYLQLIERVYNGDVKPNSIDVETTRHSAKQFMARAYEGYGGNFSSFAYDTPDYNKLAAVEKHVFQFAGAKNYQELRDITRALRDGDRFLSFKEWDEKAKSILSDYEGRYKKIEYNTTIRSAQMASKCVRYDKDPHGLVKYVGSGADSECPICRPFNDIILPWTHPFWGIANPLNHIGCNCSTLALNDGARTPDAAIPGFETIPTAFRTNLAKTGMIFPKEHAYFIGIPKDVKQQINNLIPDRSKAA